MCAATPQLGSNGYFFDIDSSLVQDNQPTVFRYGHVTTHACCVTSKQEVGMMFKKTTSKQELVEEFECLLVTHVCRYLYYALCMCCIADDHVFGDATLKV